MQSCVLRRANLYSGLGLPGHENVAKVLLEREQARDQQESLIFAWKHSSPKYWILGKGSCNL
jgi:hypothetical protein